MIGRIYKITNQKNQHCYIGQTRNTLECRFQQHYDASKTQKYKDLPLYQAFNKYGFKNFQIELIEEIEESKLDEREIYWIDFYDSYNNGYNATLGGESRRLFDYYEIINLYQQGLDMAAIIRKIGCSHQTYTRALRSAGITRQDTIKQVARKHWKPINQIDLKTKQVICTFSNLKEIAKHLGKNTTSVSSISAVCKGKRKSAFGYGWEYVNADKS